MFATSVVFLFFRSSNGITSTSPYWSSFTCKTTETYVRLRL
jgi:hypothetical protein